MERIDERGALELGRDGNSLELSPCVEPQRGRIRQRARTGSSSSSRDDFEIGSGGSADCTDEEAKQRGGRRVEVAREGEQWQQAAAADRVSVGWTRLRALALHLPPAAGAPWRASPDVAPAAPPLPVPTCLAMAGLVVALQRVVSSSPPAAAFCSRRRCTRGGASTFLAGDATSVSPHRRSRPRERAAPTGAARYQAPERDRALGTVTGRPGRRTCGQTVPSHCGFEPSS